MEPALCMYNYVWQHKWLWSILDCSGGFAEWIKSRMRVWLAAVWESLLLSVEKCCFGDKHSTANTSFCFLSTAFVFLSNSRTKGAIVVVSDWLFLDVWNDLQTWVTGSPRSGWRLKLLLQFNIDHVCTLSILFRLINPHLIVEFLFLFGLYY